MDKKCRRSRRCEGRGDLATDVAGLAHAGHDEATAGRADQLDRRHKGIGQPVLYGRDERRNAAGLGLERPLGAFEEQTIPLVIRRAALIHRFGHYGTFGLGEGAGPAQIPWMALTATPPLNRALTTPILDPLTISRLRGRH